MLVFYQICPGKAISVTYGKNLSEAKKMAKEAMELYIGSF